MMFANSLISDIIQTTFEANVERGSGDAMLVCFRDEMDYSEEEGYRHSYLLLQRPTNYTRVLSAKSWDVIPVDDLEHSEDGECYPKDGKSYAEGSSVWTELCYHDSGWRQDGVYKFISTSKIRGIGYYFYSADNRPNWFKILRPGIQLVSLVQDGPTKEIIKELCSGK